MPNLTGVSHISLSVRDRDVSVRWYVDVLGFAVVADMDEDRWKRSVCLDPSGVMLSLTEHQNPKPFDYGNMGVDRSMLSFSDPNGIALELFHLGG